MNLLHGRDLSIDGKTRRLQTVTNCDSQVTEKRRHKDLKFKASIIAPVCRWQNHSSEAARSGLIGFSFNAFTPAMAMLTKSFTVSRI